MEVQELAVLCNDLFLIAEDKQELKNKEKALNEVQRQTEAKIMAAFEENKLQSFDTEKGKVFLKNRSHFKMLDKDAFKKHIGADTWNLLATINSQSLNKFCKDQLEEAQMQGDVAFSLPGVEESGITQIAKRKKT